MEAMTLWEEMHTNGGDAPRWGTVRLLEQDGDEIQGWIWAERCSGVAYWLFAFDSTGRTRVPDEIGNVEVADSTVAFEVAATPKQSKQSHTWTDFRGRHVTVAALPAADGQWAHVTHWWRNEDDGSATVQTEPSLVLPWPVAQELADLISGKDGGYEAAAAD